MATNDDEEEDITTPPRGREKVVVEDFEGLEPIREEVIREDSPTMNKEQAKIKYLEDSIAEYYSSHKGEKTPFVTVSKYSSFTTDPMGKKKKGIN